MLIIGVELDESDVFQGILVIHIEKKRIKLRWFLAI